MEKIYKYGMKLRGFSLGCQPKKGFIKVGEKETEKYHDVLYYNRKLTEKEVEDYELVLLGEMKNERI